MPAENHHCSVLQIDGRGVLLEGKAGLGKSSLLLSLLEKAKVDGYSASLVADDQALLDIRHDRLVAQVPPTIIGKVEVFGYGLTTLPNLPETAIDLVVELVKPSQINRMPDANKVDRLGIEVPVLKVPALQETWACRMIFTWLNDNFA